MESCFKPEYIIRHITYFGGIGFHGCNGNASDC